MSWLENAWYCPEKKILRHLKITSLKEVNKIIKETWWELWDGISVIDFSKWKKCLCESWQNWFWLSEMFGFVQVLFWIRKKDDKQYDWEGGNPYIQLNIAQNRSYNRDVNNNKDDGRNRLVRGIWLKSFSQKSRSIS